MRACAGTCGSSVRRRTSRPDMAAGDLAARLDLAEARAAIADLIHDYARCVRRDRPELRAAFDYGLDQAQETGATAKIIRTYVPLPPW